MTSGKPPERKPLLGLNRRARWLLPILLILLVGLTFRHLLFPDPHAITLLSGSTMGTTWSVKLVGPLADSTAHKRVLRAIETELDHVNRLMSTWDANSELSELNRWKSPRPFPVSRPTFEVLELAAQVSELSGGAFDVTVGPLVAAWGFGADAKELRSPSAEEVEILRERVGYRGLRLDDENLSVTKTHPDISADLSAIAKGYAVDLVAEAVLALGHENFLVEIGGELKARGQKRPGRDWRVAVENPDGLVRSIYAVVALRDLGLATSGDYRSFLLEDGTRRSHLIDPRIGGPVVHTLASASVAHPSTARADALATAFGVMGVDEAFALAKREGVAAFFIVRNSDGQLSERVTPAFSPLLVTGPPETAP